MTSAELAIEKQVVGQAALIATKITRAADDAVGKPHPEKLFRQPVEDFLADFANSLDVQLDARQEYTLLSGRADTIYNRLIIEFERPGYLSRKPGAASNAHALQQLRDYISDVAKAERQKLLAGVALDGRYFIFARLKEGHWYVDPPEPVTNATTERFLRYLLSLQTELSLTSENLIRDFGEGSQAARKCVGRLYSSLADALQAKKPKRVEILFRQWSELFSEVCDFKAGTKKLKVEEVAAEYGVVTDSLDLFRLFYCIHTYYSTFIKLLAYQVASHYASPGDEAQFGHLGAVSRDDILSFLREIEKGGVFREKLRINNFLEADFFDWYLDLWNDELYRGIGGIIRRLGDYSLLTLDTDPETTRDILKGGSLSVR